MKDQDLGYVMKMFNMNMEVKTLLYKASCDPINRKELVEKALKLVDDFYNLPKGYLQESE